MKRDWKKGDEPTRQKSQNPRTGGPEYQEDPDEYVRRLRADWD